MTWSYWKHCFSKSSSPKVPFWTRFFDFEIKQFWNQTFFSGKLFFRHWAVRSWASQTDPEFLTESQKSSQQNSAVFHTRQYSGTHYAQVLNFLSGNCLNLKVNRNMFLYLINCHFDTVFISKFYVFWEFPDKFHWNRLQCTARQTRSSENREQNLNHSKSSKKFKANIFQDQRMVNAEVFKIITKFVIFI